MATKGVNWMLVIGIVAVAYFVLVGNPFASDTVAPTDNGGTDITVCDSSTTPDLDINAYDAENPGTALTEATNLYRKLGNTAWTSFTAGTAITNLEVGEKYEVVMGIGATDWLDNAYGPYFVTDKIACNELTSMDIALDDDDIETALTATFYNNDGAASPESFVAGDVQDIGVRFKAGSENVFGNKFIATSGLGDNGNHRAAYPNALCLEVNNTQFDTPAKVEYAGVEMNRISTPTRLAGTAGNNSYCYEAPVIDDVGQTLQVWLDADDTLAPSMNATAFLFAGGFYINADTGELAWGVENEQGAAVATDTYDSLNLDVS